MVNSVQINSKPDEMDGIEELWFNINSADKKNPNPDERPDERPDGVEQLWLNMKSADKKNPNPDERPDELWFRLRQASTTTTEVSKKLERVVFNSSLFLVDHKIDKIQPLNSA